MGMKQRTRNPDIHLSQKDITSFFDLTDQDVENLINLKMLTPKMCGGKILFRLTELWRASLNFEKQQ